MHFTRPECKNLNRVPQARRLLGRWRMISLSYHPVRASAVGLLVNLGSHDRNADSESPKGIRVTKTTSRAST